MKKVFFIWMIAVWAVGMQAKEWVFSVNGVPFTMVEVPGGVFRMGCSGPEGECDPSAMPAHEVQLSDFCIGQTEVTQGLWQAVMGTSLAKQRDTNNKKGKLNGEGANYPMYYISWNDCQSFIDKLNEVLAPQLGNLRFCLPTEAQWEYAAQGGEVASKPRFSGNNIISSVAWYKSNSGGKTHPVAAKAANALGIYDMTGNVREWCHDYGGDYSTEPQTDPVGAPAGLLRIVRGGAYNNSELFCPIVNRGYDRPKKGSDNTGMRLALSGVPKEGAQNTEHRPQTIDVPVIEATKSAVDLNIPETKVENTNTFVLIFANEDYQHVAPVAYAKNDGTIFKQYCVRTLGIPENHIQHIENATYNNMRMQMEWLKDVCSVVEDARLIIYYSGHGFPDESTRAAYLLPIDGDGRYVSSAYSLDEFYRSLGALNAQSVTVFLDACFSGSVRNGDMLYQAHGVALKPKPGVPQGKTVVFSAAQADETAGFMASEQHGMFTYFLLKKLQETQGEVTLQELADYIVKNVQRESLIMARKKQTPCVIPSGTMGETWKTITLR